VTPNVPINAGSDPTPTAAPEERGGVLRRLFRRIALELLRLELEAAQRQRAAMESSLTAVTDKADTLDGRVADVMRQIGSVERGAAETRRRLETRVEETAARFEELRRVFLATRANLEGVRDQRLEDLARRLDAIESVGLTAVQREIENLRDQRIPAAERGLGEVHAGIESLQAEVERVRDDRLPELATRFDALMSGPVEDLQAEIESLRDDRVPRVAAESTRLHAAVEGLQAELTEVRDRRLAHVETDLARLQGALEEARRLAEEVRDARLPALSGRVDALLESVCEDLAATSGLLDRMLAGEPLRVAAEPVADEDLPEAVRRASERFLETFRGSQEEITARVSEYLPLLAGQGPVLDLGCGRGELLRMLRDAGVACEGVDSDPAMVEACRRDALRVAQLDALAALRARAEGSLGGVTAIHIVEHLSAATWMAMLEAAARALRPGGLLIIESPNPESLRVSADLFWIDPTHLRPVHPEAVAFVLRAVGMTIEQVLRRRPFPSEQSLRRVDQSNEIAALAERLDAWLSADRDYAIIARK
jgi:SAM-dependent methyltransferase/predicted  nucleic acid-binding Zn-ribbon protein